MFETPAIPDITVTTTGFLGVGNSDRTGPRRFERNPETLMRLGRVGKSLVNLPALHHERHVPEHRNVLQRITLHTDDVCLHSWSEHTVGHYRPEVSQA